MGMLVWFVAVVAPEYMDLGVLSWLSPSGAFDFDLGVAVSLALNTVVYLIVSILTKPRLADRIQAFAFMGSERPVLALAQTPLLGTVGDLRRLLEQFLGVDDGRRAFAAFADQRRHAIKDSDPVDPDIARSTERMLAGAIGASSARNVITLTLAHAGRDASDISDILDEAAQAVHFSRELLHTTLESLDQGICVVDRDLRLVAWNNRYLALFQLSSSHVFIGKSLEELMRFCALRDGEKGVEVERLVGESLGPVRRGVVPDV